MHTKRFLPLLALPALLSLYEPGAEVRFAPAEDTEVSMAFTNRVELFLDDFAAEAMGQDMGAMIGDVEMSVTMDLEAAFTDTYRSSGDNRPMTFSRLYDGASMSGEFSAAAQGESEGESFEVESALEGSTVDWRWDEDEEDYVPAWPEDEDRDEETLEGLLPRLDLAFMLPTEEVAEGDSWDIDALELAALLLPGGDLGYDTEGGDRGEMEDGFDEEQLEEMMSDLFEGEVKATFKGMRDELAEIEISLEIDGDEDFADMVADGIAQAIEISGEEVDPSMIPSIETFTMSVALEGEGVLLWDMGAGHARSFEMSSELEFGVEVEIFVAQEGMEFPVTGEVLLGGSMEVAMEAE